jgi:uncharacterized phosphosugar-binding protein
MPEAFSVEVIVGDGESSESARERLDLEVASQAKARGCATFSITAVKASVEQRPQCVLIARVSGN